MTTDMQAKTEREIRKSMTSEQIQLERKLTCEAIDGAMAFGHHGTNLPPSDDHWLAPFWKIGRKLAELEAALASRPDAQEIDRLKAIIAGPSASETIHQVWVEETSSWADVTPDYYSERLPSNRRKVYYTPTFSGRPDAQADERGSAAYVECRECVECGHIGINDSHPTDAACDHSCDWTGPSPIEDKCPGCGNENVMTAACPKCSGRYKFMADATIKTRAAAPQAEAAQGVPSAKLIGLWDYGKPGCVRYEPDFPRGDIPEGAPVYVGAAPSPDREQAGEQNTDDLAVDSFARAMKAKMADARAKGRSGWEGMDPPELSRMLSEHVEKGDPRDVANFCMMLWHHSASITAQPQAAEPKGLTDEQIEKAALDFVKKPGMQGYVEPGDLIDFARALLAKGE